MLRRLAFVWLPSLLYRLALVAAAALILLVLVAPILDNGRWRVVALFADDAATRRTAIACALGLAVTACVFFRPSETPPPRRSVRSSKAPPPPPGVAGA